MAEQKKKPGCFKIGCFTVLLFFLGLTCVLYIYNNYSDQSSSPTNKSAVQKKIAKKAKKPKIKWKTLANNLIKDYRGKIDSIEQLNSTTCWAVLSRVSTLEAVQTAANIGDYIRNVSGKTPSVHAFLNGRHVAVARQGIGHRVYSGKLHIQDWHAFDFGGQYRPKD